MGDGGWGIGNRELGKAPFINNGDEPFCHRESGTIIKTLGWAGAHQQSQISVLTAVYSYPPYNP